MQIGQNLSYITYLKENYFIYFKEIQKTCKMDSSYFSKSTCVTSIESKT